MPKDGRVSDKTLVYNIVAGVIGILLCLTSLTAATWAWFGSSVTSQNNSIQSGQYDVSVSVHDNGVADSGELLTATADGSYMLAKGRTYRITLEGVGSVSTGYCSIRLEGSSEPLHTQQVYTPEYADSGAGKYSVISFELSISDSLTDTVSLSVIPCWGSSALPEEKKLFDGGEYSYDGAEISVKS